MEGYQAEMATTVPRGGVDLAEVEVEVDVPDVMEAEVAEELNNDFSETDNSSILVVTPSPFPFPSLSPSSSYSKAMAPTFCRGGVWIVELRTR